MSTSSVLGASVGELLDRADAELYLLATGLPSGNRLLAAWPAYAAACARLMTAAAGRRAAGHAVVSRWSDTDPVLMAGSRLYAHIKLVTVATRGALPHPRVTRATELIGAAADLIECARDRPGVAQREVAQAATSRSAGIIRAAEMTLAGTELTLRACGRAHQQSPTTSPNTRARLTWRAAPLFETRRLAAEVLDAAGGRPDRSDLDGVRVPGVGSPRPGDLLDDLQVATAAWRAACLATVHGRAPSSAELQRASVEARHLIALNAALTDSARASGSMSPTDAILTMAQLQRAGAAWSAVTTAWTERTTGVPPIKGHIAASLQLQQAIRAIGRDETGAWLAPEALADRVVLPAAFAAAGTGLANVLDVGRAHADAVSLLVRQGGVFALANKLAPSEERVEARLRGGHVPVALAEATTLLEGYVASVDRSGLAFRQVSAASQGCLVVGVGVADREVRRRHVLLS